MYYDMLSLRKLHSYCTVCTCIIFTDTRALRALVSHVFFTYICAGCERTWLRIFWALGPWGPSYKFLKRRCCNYIWYIFYSVTVTRQLLLIAINIPIVIGHVNGSQKRWILVTIKIEFRYLKFIYGYSFPEERICDLWDQPTWNLGSIRTYYHKPLDTSQVCTYYKSQSQISPRKKYNWVPANLNGSTHIPLASNNADQPNCEWWLCS